MEWGLGKFLVIMLSINVVLFFVQNAILEANPAGPVIYNHNGSLVHAYEGEGYSFGANSSDYAIETSDSVDTDTGVVYTDTFRTSKGWLDRQETKAGAITGIFKQPYGFLKDVGVPPPICLAFGVIWYTMAGLLLIGWLRGSNQ